MVVISRLNISFFKGYSQHRTCLMLILEPRFALKIISPCISRRFTVCWCGWGLWWRERGVRVCAVQDSCTLSIQTALLLNVLWTFFEQWTGQQPTWLDSNPVPCGQYLGLSVHSLSPARLHKHESKLLSRVADSVRSLPFWSNTCFFLPDLQLTL